MAKVRIVCIGDSTTYGFPYGPQDSWVKMLENEIWGQVLNKGINGNTTTNMLYRFDRAVLPYEPDYVIIMGGINDVVANESLDKIQFNIGQMVEKALQNNIIPVIGLPTPVDFKPWENILQKLRVWLANYASHHNLNIINFAQAFFRNDGTIRTDLLLDDGGHPAREGYKLMFRQIDLNIFNKGKQP